MSVKITYDKLRTPNFIRAFNSISTFPNYENFETKKRIFVLGKQLDKVHEEVVKAHTELVGSYALKNEDGSFVEREGRPGTFIVPEERAEEYTKALADFDATEVELEGKKIKGQFLDKAPLSPSDLLWVEDLIDLD